MSLEERIALLEVKMREVEKFMVHEKHKEEFKQMLKLPFFLNICGHVDVT